MNHRKFFTLLFIFFLGTQLLLVKACFSAPQKQTAATQAKEAGNKICPVSGEKIKKSEEYKMAYEGKTYNLCCKMCAKDFKKNPQKYIQIIEKQK